MSLTASSSLIDLSMPGMTMNTDHIKKLSLDMDPDMDKNSRKYPSGELGTGVQAGGQIDR